MNQSPIALVRYREVSPANPVSLANRMVWSSSGEQSTNRLRDTCLLSLPVLALQAPRKRPLRTSVTPRRVPCRRIWKHNQHIILFELADVGQNAKCRDDLGLAAAVSFVFSCRGL